MNSENVLHDLKIKFQNVLFKNHYIYRRYLTKRLDLNFDYLSCIKNNVVLKSNKEIETYTNIVRNLGLPIRSDISKNWDSLIAYSKIVQRFPKEANILDAGAEIYSSILPWLFLTGYQNLHGINIVFRKKFRRGTIAYDYGDITQTKFHNKSYDAITCLSVVEHGVDLEKFFHEMSRILKPGGILILSTDYFETQIDVGNKVEYGNQIKIFNKTDILSIIEIALDNNLTIKGDLDLSCLEKPVNWKRFSLEFTYITLIFEKIIK